MGFVGPLIPPAKRSSGERSQSMREVVNALMYVLSTGCQWRAIPKDLPPRSTVHGYCDPWGYQGTLLRLHHALYVQCRRRPGVRPVRRLPSSTARASRAQKKGVSIDPPWYDAGKKFKGKKRHVLVDTQGLLLHVLLHAADVQDRDGGVLIVATLFGHDPFLRKLYAYGGYQGPIFQAAVRRACRRLKVEIVKRSYQAKGFTVLPKR